MEILFNDSDKLEVKGWKYCSMILTNWRLKNGITLRKF